MSILNFITIQNHKLVSSRREVLIRICIAIQGEKTANARGSARRWGGGEGGWAAGFE